MQNPFEYDEDHIFIIKNPFEYDEAFLHKKFDAIYRKYWRWVISCTRRYIDKDEEARRDLEQLVWLRIWAYTGILRTEFSLTSIISKMTHQVYCTEIKKKSYKLKKNRCDIDEVAVYYDYRDSLDTFFELDLLIDIITGRIKKKYREVSVLKWLYGFTQEEVSIQVNVPLNKVRSLLTMARKEIIYYYKILSGES